jgi:hypothetical protein
VGSVFHEIEGFKISFRIVVEPCLLARGSDSRVCHNISSVTGLVSSVAFLDVESQNHGNNRYDSEDLGAAVENLVEKATFHVSKSVGRPDEASKTVSKEVPVGSVGPGADLFGVKSPFVVVSAGAGNSSGEKLIVGVDPVGVPNVNLGSVSNLSKDVESNNKVGLIGESLGDSRVLPHGSFAVVQTLEKVTH